MGLFKTTNQADALQTSVGSSSSLIYLIHKSDLLLTAIRYGAGVALRVCCLPCAAFADLSVPDSSDSFFVTRYE